MADVVEDLRLLIRTRHPIVTIRTLDEDFAVRTIRKAAHEMNMAALEWTISKGVRRIEPAGDNGIVGTQKLLGALKFMAGNEAFNIYILKDAMGHLRDDESQRYLREIAMSYGRDNRTVFMLDADGSLPATVQPFAVPYELALPDEKETFQIVRDTVGNFRKYMRVSVKLTEDELAAFMANLRGLTRAEISQVVADVILSDNRLDGEDIQRVIDLKRRRFRQSGVLDYIAPPDKPLKVGGMKNLRNWLKRRAKALTPQAKKFGLEPPRGILMLGVQGCGKSLMARIVAADWKLPLLRMDVGALYDKFVGETERHLRGAFKVASAMAPCVLWIDEIEKAFASAGAGGGGARADGGLSQRMFGQLLTWMQDRTEPVFLVATANDISALPPELMRKGRFDEIFFVDLPDADARRQILKIHLARRNRKAGDFDVEQLAAAAEGFSGSEIEQAIVSAMYSAFSEDRKLRSDDILREIEGTQPLSVVMAEKIAELRNWATGRCVPAN